MSKTSAEQVGHPTHQEFDLIASPLAGKNLIEASAGTGKTHTITALYLRLLLEQKLTVDRILVVTFTEAATNELNERIRSTLLQAKNALRTGRCENPFIAEYFSKKTPPADAESRLNQAFRDFDEAAIHTIHRFCNRVLQENAFESRGLFDTELVTEQSELLLQIVEDFWRTHLYAESGMFLRYALDKVHLQDFFQTVKDKVGLPYLRLIPATETADSAAPEAEFRSAWERLRRLWRKTEGEVTALLLQTEGLNQKTYRPAQIRNMLEQMEIYLSADEPDPLPPEELEKLTSENLARGTTRQYTPPQHPLFDAMTAFVAAAHKLQQTYEKRLLALQRELIEYTRAELKKRKQEHNIYFFDDLLLNLHAVLCQPEGQALARAVRTKYRAALIDEFQDTDPVQYEIFKTIFDHDDSTLFLIGDPKQAIYGFRGADVFAYMRARQEVSQHYTLRKNYRSAPKLLDAFNAIFGNVDRPFIFPEIQFQEARAGHEIYPVLHIEGETDAPFKLWFVPADTYNRENLQKALPAQTAEDLVVRCVAGEIARLLRLGREGKAHIDGEALEERHIAVLVRKNKEARRLQDALRRLNIHSVLYSSANLFASTEARDCELILAAAAEPKRSARIKSALGTEIIGLSAEDLLHLEQDEAALEAWFDRFARYHHLWQDFGFMRMFKELLYEEQCHTRLMAYPDGERRMTNVLHLAEMLNRAEAEQRLSVTGLLKWLANHRASTAIPAEEHQLRLESDEKAVKLVTMHMSKGLQYPIVFCPFTWHGVWLSNPKQPKFHDRSRDDLLTLDLGSLDSEQHRQAALKEELAENLRLLYVALTRAERRCYLVWGRLGSWFRSAPAYLFHQRKIINQEDLVNTLGNQIRTFRDHVLWDDLSSVVASSGGGIEQVAIPEPQADPLLGEAEETQALRCREFTGSIDRSERVASYSALVSKQPPNAELADYDFLTTAITEEATDAEPLAATDYASFLTFPKGPRTGTFVHEIFQNLDFTSPGSAENRILVQSRLQQHSFQPQWESAVLNMIENVLTRRLDAAGQSFHLAQVEPGSRISELAFYFPVERLDPQTLLTAFSAPGSAVPTAFSEALQGIAFAPFRGFMKGYIDLVFEFGGRFFIIDWKSNYLGRRIQDYNQPALTQAMCAHLYILQYHIYTVALHQYLRLRLPDYDYDTHFGGVFYLFLRGVDPEAGPDYGVYQARPPKTTVNTLEEILGQREV